MIKDKIPKEMLEQLVNLKVASVKDGKYVYAPEFEESVNSLKSNPPSRIEQMKIGRRVAKHVVKNIFLNRHMPRNRHDIENLVVAYVCLEYHLKRIGEELPSIVFPEVSYCVWYVNDHEVKVE